mmetsp:Transcript_70432/g.222528  ORF Transcript_70432/g.222528 Transcript_70432/m.222528 type:complete len:231 (-) Transcript_70432:334-1026(-)
MRSSRKNLMIRMTLATRTTRTMRMTRSTVMFPRTSLPDPLSTNEFRKRSTKLNATTTTSKMFQEMSLPRKNPQNPWHTQRAPNSTLNTKLKATCSATKTVGVCTCSGRLFLASDSARSATYCVCAPMNRALRMMSVPLNTSYLRLLVMRSSQDTLTSTTVSRGTISWLRAIVFLLAVATLETMASGRRFSASRQPDFSRKGSGSEHTTGWTLCGCGGSGGEMLTSEACRA